MYSTHRFIEKKKEDVDSGYGESELFQIPFGRNAGDPYSVFTTGETFSL